MYTGRGGEYATGTVDRWTNKSLFLSPFLSFPTISILAHSTPLTSLACSPFVELMTSCDKLSWELLSPPQYAVTPLTVEFHKVLGMTAVVMMGTFLRRYKKNCEMVWNGVWAINDARLSLSFAQLNFTGYYQQSSPKSSPRPKDTRPTRTPPHVSEGHHPTWARIRPKMHRAMQGETGGC